jgi:hypothetical protein
MIVSFRLVDCVVWCGVVSDDGQHGDADEQRQHGKGV